jgi:hypothetical protein
VRQAHPEVSLTGISFHLSAHASRRSASCKRRRLRSAGGRNGCFGTVLLAMGNRSQSVLHFLSGSYGRARAFMSPFLKQPSLGVDSNGVQLALRELAEQCELGHLPELMLRRPVLLGRRLDSNGGAAARDRTGACRSFQSGALKGFDAHPRRITGESQRHEVHTLIHPA